MNERIKELRKILNLTQNEFAAKLLLSQNFIAQVESGKKNISERTVADICREFNINVEWLRTGEGDMFNIPEDEDTVIASELLEEDNPFYNIIKGIVKTYMELDEKSKQVLCNYGQDLLKNLQKEKRED